MYPGKFAIIPPFPPAPSHVPLTLSAWRGRAPPTNSNSYGRPRASAGTSGTCSDHPGFRPGLSPSPLARLLSRARFSLRRFHHHAVTMITRTMMAATTPPIMCPRFGEEDDESAGEEDDVGVVGAAGGAVSVVVAWASKAQPLIGMPVMVESTWRVHVARPVFPE